MSRKGFFWGLVAGMAIMALLLVLVGGAIWGVRWERDGLSDKTVLRFRFDQRELPEGLAPRGLPHGFGLRGFPIRPGLPHRGIAWAALCCGPVLLLIFGGLVVLGLAGVRRLGLHCPVCDAIWGGPTERAEDTEAADEAVTAEDSAADS